MPTDLEALFAQKRNAQAQKEKEKQVNMAVINFAPGKAPG
jgi:hypothetical protein